MGLLDLIRGNQIPVTNVPATATNATEAGLPTESVAKIAVAQPSVAQIQYSAPPPPGPGTQASELNPDRYCWPHGPAMNTEEIDLLLSRLEVFCAKGLDESMAEKLADCPVYRDRDWDDRRSCFECRHLKGNFQLRCDNWKVARISYSMEGALRNKDDCMILQRCDGFSPILDERRN